VTRIKISGLMQPDDAALAADLGVDILACVFNAKSPRYVTIEQAWAVRRAAGARVRLAGVFVDAPLPLVERVAQSCQLDLVQLFGSEPRGDVEALGPLAYKAVTVADSESLDAAVRAYAPSSRRARRGEGPALLLHLSGAVAGEWSLVAGLAQRVPLVLAASALVADTAAEAIATVQPWALDVWDAVEREPGRLDGPRLTRFVEAVRAADAAAAPLPSEERRA
jgi:phosphoribosylanthranilate isomerase